MLRQLFAGLIHTSLSRILGLCSGFVLTFLLARSFTPEQYGVYGLMSTSLWLLAPLIGLMLSSYVSRAIPGKSESDQIRILKVTLLSEMGLTASFALVVTFSGALDEFLRRTQVTAYHAVFVGMLVLLVVNSAQSELAQFAYGKVEIKKANYMDLLLQSGWVAPLAVTWLLGLRIDLSIVLLFMIAGSLSSSLLGIRMVDLRAFREARFDVGILRKAVFYGVPLIVPAMNYGLLRFVDRFFLASMTSMESLGLYAFAGTIVNLLFTLSYRIFTATMQPYIIRAHNEGDVLRRDLLLTYLLKFSLMIFAAGVTAFMTFGYRLLLPLVRPEYVDSVHWVGWIAVTHALLILNFPGQLLLLLQNRTHVILTVELTGLALMITLSALLIPRLGVLGGILAGWAAWGFVAVAEATISGAHRVIVWNQFWGFRQDIAVGRKLLAKAFQR